MHNNHMKALVLKELISNTLLDESFVAGEIDMRNNIGLGSDLGEGSSSQSGETKSLYTSGKFRDPEAKSSI